jgi:hypothetical protein
MSYVDLDALVKGATYIYLTGGSLVTADHVRVNSTDCGFYMERGTLALRDSTISSGVVHTNESYLLMDRTSLTGAQLISERYRAGQPLYLNNLTATGTNDDAPFLLTGFDHFFGAQNSIAGNLLPVHLAGGGIAPGSTLPLSGNTLNIIHGGQGEVTGRVTFPNLGLDYRIDYPGDNNTWLGGRLVIEPGATVRLAPGAYFFATYSSAIDARGTAERPITFTRLDPGQAWQTIDFAINGNRPVLSHCVIDGALRGVVADETLVRIRECSFTNNAVANRSVNYLLSEIRKCRFTGNGVGIQGAGNAGFDARGGAMPNLLQGNSVGAENLDVYSFHDATGNYWGSPTGPASTLNPGGTGDPANPYVSVVPFRATAPDFTDSAPTVRLLPPSFHNEPGARVLLTWTASDDHGIVSQRIEWGGHNECSALQVIAANIPATARSWEITIPAYELSSCIDPAVLRVVAADSTGQEGFDEAMYNVHRLDDGQAPTPLPLAGPYHPGELVGICTTGGAMFDAYLFLDSENWAVSLGGTTTSCLSGGMTVPAVSTDLARVGVRSGTAWSFSPYFSIRPDASIGDTPPQVMMLTPAANQSFAAGSVVPITWSASDDEGVRSFDIHGSFDGGTTWHVIARDLPGAARSYNWQLPPSAGISALRLRVVARDLRFQVSSAGADRALAITAGTGVCYANCDQSTTAPVLNSGDFTCFLQRYAAGDPYANCDSSTTAPTLNVGDFTCFLQRFAGGCP